MMQAFPQLPASPGTKGPGSTEAGTPPLVGQGHGESFDSLILQAQSSGHSKFKNSDSGGHTPANGETKPDTNSGFSALDAAAVLGAGLPITANSPIPTIPVAKSGAGGQPPVISPGIRNGQSILPNQASEASGDVANALAGKVAQAESTAGKIPEAGSSNAQDGKPLMAALNLQPIDAPIGKITEVKAPASPEMDVKPSTAGMTAVSELQTATRPETKAAEETVDAGAGKGAANELSSTGTPIAKFNAAMKKPEQTIRIAGATGKFLPGGASWVATKNDLLPQTQSTATSAVSAMQSGADLDRSVPTEIPPVPSGAGLGTIERTQEMVVQHAMRLGNSTADSLQVVIKPDAGTQLSLELRQRGDGVEVQAVLQQGDFNQLNQSWNHLQQQLQLRGIQLGDLTRGNDLNGNGQGLLQQGQGGGAGNLEAETPVIAAAGGAAVVPGMTANLPALAGSGRWQTWA